MSDVEHESSSDSRSERAGGSDHGGPDPDIGRGFGPPDPSPARDEGPENDVVPDGQPQGAGLELGDVAPPASPSQAPAHPNYIELQKIA